eukprot:gnl/TRDRNA2_/TRDRNA2_71630_c1_seq1.p1 gnl/TRDRNA2_/TRDRNA2_71630_c1~~gnl/TRDRNA2_/TRDRNA2_71630_c1_seq1.p1  ORF type:complete len:371 (-),score=28.54 gnl/TRDRNA2_/TRDRNA2_71630_c1_seq1:58-1050(-)
MEVTLAILMLFPSRSTLRFKRWLAVVIHLSIIFGRFDNGLAGWNTFWLCEDVLHTVGPHTAAGWSDLSPAAGALVAAQASSVLLYFLGHGSYHTGQSHHTGNFRMQWLLFRDDAAWQKLVTVFQHMRLGPPCLHGMHTTCVHTWGHGGHYPTASFDAFTYALNGGTYLRDVLPAAVSKEVLQPQEQLGEHFSMFAAEHEVRDKHHLDQCRQFDALVGNESCSAGLTDAGRPRAMYLGFASGMSVWDDAFYEPIAANTVRAVLHLEPGELRYIELDRQRPWRRTRRLRVFDLSKSLPPSPRTLLDRWLGTSPDAHLVEEKVLAVRRPFPGT